MAWYEVQSSTIVITACRRDMACVVSNTGGSEHTQWVVLHQLLLLSCTLYLLSCGLWPTPRTRVLVLAWALSGTCCCTSTLISARLARLKL
jgi:hypothetical protein